ncbi:FRG domain-containing protein [Agromyces sp. NPDC058484]|uniref:FRG domain-containing protein n=1 Tax=Agromyces sp. NPDC058484 TaxID=3346524 RepID=UPI003658123A
MDAPTADALRARERRDGSSTIVCSGVHRSGRDRDREEAGLTIYLQPVADVWVAPFADATELYSPWETEVESWADLQHEINTLGASYPDERFVWRGQADASWGMRSSLYRAVANQISVAPTEGDLVAAERRLLDLARSQWRLDGIPGLQLFAQMQHVGVPTRLLDVTYNPLIAAWFAVTQSTLTSVDDADARLFAFTVSPTNAVRLNSDWNSNTPYWFRLKSDNARQRTHWGTGLGRKLWHPPALHDRIPAQSAAFLLDGVPIEAPEHGFGRLHPGDPERWSPERLRQVSSIPMNMTNVRRGRLPVEKGPVFTYRVTAQAKPEIRDQLEKAFGYSFATVYADIEGLAEYLRSRPGLLVGG